MLEYFCTIFPQFRIRENLFDEIYIAEWCTLGSVLDVEYREYTFETCASVYAKYFENVMLEIVLGIKIKKIVSLCNSID